MATIHNLKYNGYYVGDRLLEDVYFKVSIEVDSINAEIKEVTPWDEDDAAYLAQINLDYFIPLITANVQQNLDSLRSYYEENGSDFAADMKKFEEETGEPGIQVLLEI
jgi:hypothetical protein